MSATGWSSRNLHGLPLDQSPITVQGIPIHPGDSVLVVVEGQAYRRKYEGRTENDYWMESVGPSMHPLLMPGPFSYEELRHPDILTGIAKALTDENEA